MHSLGGLPNPQDPPADAYRILAELGEGGMAKVYLSAARNAGGRERLLVLKAMQEDLALDPDLVALFQEEARLGARLKHPNVVETLAVAELLGRPMIVMEYLEGEPFSRVIHAKEGRDVTHAMKLRVVAAALEGLEYIHELADANGASLGLVHRDVSPHNIFVTFDGRVKVLDFGIAKGLGSSGPPSSRPHDLKGKIRYMAPEQMEGETVDRRADVFSVGVILWEIATGQRLWHARSEVNVMRAVLTEGVPPPKTASSTVSAELNDLCLKALARAPADRYQTAAELRAALNQVLSLETGGASVALADVGRRVGEGFAERRARTRGVIDAQLARTDIPELGRERFALPSHLPSLAAATASGSGGGAEVAVQPPRRPRRTGLVVSVAAAGVGVALLALAALTPAGLVGIRSSGSLEGVRDAGASQSGTEVPAATTDSVLVAPPEGKHVRVRLAATPPTAVLYLDGKRLRENPFDHEYPRDNGPHTVRAEAPGYVTSAAEIVLADDVQLVIPLSPAKIAAIPPHAAAAELPSKKAPPATVPPAPSTTAPNPDCSPPFYFDAQGIKRLKPECI
jgi:hypothetical protein